VSSLALTIKTRLIIGTLIVQLDAKQGIKKKSKKSIGFHCFDVVQMNKTRMKLNLAAGHLGPIHIWLTLLSRCIHCLSVSVLQFLNLNLFLFFFFFLRKFHLELPIYMTLLPILIYVILNKFI
jgi:hypothetical protein